MLAFNRTSMESKQSNATKITTNATALLIEPVWNRNVARVEFYPEPCSLLIEPVWNRNTRTMAHTVSYGSLLIEPVWNRNIRKKVDKRFDNDF